MVNGTGRSDAPHNNSEEGPTGLSLWLAIEESIEATLDGLPRLDGPTDLASQFMADIHRAVRIWLSWELWRDLQPGRYSPDGLLRTLLERDGVTIIKQIDWPPLEKPDSDPAAPLADEGTGSDV